MSEVQRLFFEADGNIESIDIQPTVTTIITPNLDADDIQAQSLSNEAIARMQQAREMIRAYTAYALSAFKDLGAAEIEQVKLKFGIKLGGKAGIPYITEGSAESNLEIEVTCKFPAQNS